MNSKSNRRQFLKQGAGVSVAGILALSNPIAKAFAAGCGLTPPQTPGPFYPGEKKFHPDMDLTSIAGHLSRAQGQIIYVRGKVVDQNCNPIQNANVEIWQACASGRYNNPKDTNPAPLDPHFKYWAEAYTDTHGEYIFKTIIPGEYPAASDWIRPPHIHFKVSKIGYRELVTQMYFRGNPFNDRDLIFNELSGKEKESLLVEFQPSPIGFEPGTLMGTFDITLRSVTG